jgi:collagenase-like PrtC family protease
MSEAAKLTLGPVLFNWPAETWRDFYFRIADEAPVESVYLGEVVCSKRAPFFAPVLDEVASRLMDAGKEVVFSTLALVTQGREADAVRELGQAEELLVEANDPTALRQVSGRPHVVGPYVNVYNEGTLGYLVSQGATRICLPFELPERSLTRLAAAAKGKAEIEVQVFGRLPLALSARCYHARAHHLHKDNCQFICGQDADGLELQTISDQPFLAINGIQTMSHIYVNLLGEMAAMRDGGIELFRLSPHSCDMVQVAEIFRAVLDDKISAEEAQAKLEKTVPGAEFSKSFYEGVPQQAEAS